MNWISEQAIKPFLTINVNTIRVQSFFKINHKNKNILLLDFNAAQGKYLQYKYQNYTVAYTRGGEHKIGILRKFFKIENSHYCVIQSLIKSSNFIDENEENLPVIKYLDRYFQICKFSENFYFIKFEEISSKCVILIKDNEVFASIFNNFDAIMD